MKKSGLEIWSFIGDGLQGNAHLVFEKENRENLSDRELARLSCANPGKIVALIEDCSGSAISARFFQNGREIKRCGSGALAVAYFHFLTPILSNDKQRLELSTVSGSVFVGRKKGKFYCEFPCLQYSSGHARGEFWRRLVRYSISNVTLVEGKQGYSIVELRREKDVANWNRNLDLLKRFSQRALILTAQSDNSRYDYVMRYFSPQYSEEEDAATGSANAILGLYWQNKLKLNCVKGLQLSIEGGEFWVERVGNRQRVWGRVTEAVSE